MHPLSPDATPDHGSFALPWRADEAWVVDDPDELHAHLDALPVEDRRRVRVLGELTNTVPAEDVPGTVLLFRDGTGMQVDEAPDGAVHLTVDASRSLDDVVADTTSRGWHGMELMSGIPGTIGAGVVQNAGAYGQQLSDVLVEAQAYDVEAGEVRTLSPADLDFGYRTSALKPTSDAPVPLVLLRVTCRVGAGAPAELTYEDLARHHDDSGRAADDVAARRESVLEVRARKGMVVGAPTWRPSVGSFFVGAAVPEEVALRVATQVRGEDFARRMLSWYRPDGDAVRLPAALVLRAAGFMNGDHWGPVGLSDLHLLALCNRGGATGTDVLAVSELIRRTVRERLDIDLQREVILLGDFPDVDVDAYARAHPKQAGEGEPDWARATSDE